MEAMVSITDELRNFAASEASDYDDWVDGIIAIVDNIDAAHRSALGETVAAAYAEGVESVPIAVDENAWVRLPVDADGVPIHVGDVLTHGTVACIRLTTKGWEIVVGYNGGSGMFNPSAMHHRAPTVEDVLGEFADRVCNSGHQWGLDAADTIAEFAAKLRLAGEE